VSRCKLVDRPLACRICGSPAWWNGYRFVAQMILDAMTLAVAREQRVRRRARCSIRGCPGGSWTVYEETGYPHRSFQLPVAASAVAEMALDPDATMAGVAKRVGCDRRSVGRWVGWTATLADPPALLATVARLDPDGLPPPRPPKRPAGRPEEGGFVLRLLDRLAGILRHRGVDLGAVEPGLAAILRHQLDRFGEVFYLTKESPPLHVDGSVAMA
jgi:hypothetical protein